MQSLKFHSCVALPIVTSNNPSTSRQYDSAVSMNAASSASTAVGRPSALFSRNSSLAGSTRENSSS